MTRSPYVVILNDSEEAALRRLANSARASQRDVLRARIVLAAAQDTPNAHKSSKPTPHSSAQPNTRAHELADWAPRYFAAVTATGDRSATRSSSVDDFAGATA